MNSRDLLERLVAFPSVSSRSNGDIAAFMAAHLEDCGVRAELLPSPGADKVNLVATLGPAGHGDGTILSGHMDVVPVAGQHWASDPFSLRERDGRLYGRGAADMKGFLACVLSLVSRLKADRLRAPIHLCFSHDEEIGCVGVRPMLDVLAARGLRARCCIVGEPTGMALVTGHKGKLAATAVCHGTASHSALAPKALNAIHLATDLVTLLRRQQERLRREGAQDTAYAIPYSTLHAGLIQGGTALNIVPDRCTVRFEIRTVGADSPSALLEAVAADAAALVAAERAAFPDADITFAEVDGYPGLDTPADGDAVAAVAALLDAKGVSKVVYGTEGGLFAERLGVATVVCGPGSMDQAHKPDEFIAGDQLDRCDAMLDRLAAALST